jgi:ferredoxin
MDRPCLVCHEVCPVSPKAIFTRTVNEIIRDGDALPAWMFGPELELEAPLPADLNLASGDYYLGVVDQPEMGLRRILARKDPMLTVEGPPALSGLAAEKVQVDIVIRLERPFVDPARCIGCGMCEHDCPVSGQRAIRVFSENESRAKSGRLVI